MQYRMKCETICTALRKQIIERTIPPETRLTASKLSKIFGVSRTPIREALWVLESEGLIDYSPNKGFKVNRITIEDIEKIYAIRVHNC